jgi:hypothetical protein
LGLVVLGCQQAPPSPRGCAISVDRPISFTAPDAGDRIFAQTVGQTCTNAVAVLTIRDPDGAAIWAFAMPFRQGIGGALISPDGADLSAEAVTAALTTWIEGAPRPASTVVDWPAGATAPEGESRNARWITTLDPLTYRDIRARNLPVLCYVSGPRRSQCVFFEPAAGQAAVLYDVEG